MTAMTDPLDALLVILDKWSNAYGDRYGSQSAAAAIRELRALNEATLAAYRLVAQREDSLRVELEETKKQLQLCRAALDGAYI